MRLRFWASTDVGRVRKLNEDNFLVDKRLNLFVVCDGMGGHAAGEVASAIGVRTVRDVIHANRELLQRHERNPDDVPTRREVLKLVERAVLDANSRVYEASIEDESKRGMGTTCCMLLLSGKRGFIGHVGDSRIYMLRENALHQMTEDHSLYNEMVRMGKIKPGEPINLPNKNAVTRAVGVREHVDVDVMEFDAYPGDRILTCSDGLSGYFGTDDEVVEMMKGEVKDVTESFIEFAVSAGGRDNITAIVVDVDSIEPVVDEDEELVDELLKQVPYFQYLTAKEHGVLRELIDSVTLEPGEVLFEQDDVAELYMVLKGGLTLERDGEAYDLLEPGGYVGDLGFIDSQPNGFRAVSSGASKILVLERSRFMKLLKSKPALAVKLQWNFLQMFAIKLREAEIAALPEVSLEPVDPVEDVTPAAGELVFKEDELRQSVAEASGPDLQVPQTTAPLNTPPPVEPAPPAPAPATPAPAAPAMPAAPTAPAPMPAPTGSEAPTLLPPAMRRTEAPTVPLTQTPKAAPSEAPARPPVPTTPKLKNPFSVRPPSLSSVNPFDTSSHEEAASVDGPPSKVVLGQGDIGLAEPTAPPTTDDHTMDLDDAIDLLDFSDGEEESEPAFVLSDELMAPGMDDDDDLRSTIKFDKDELDASMARRDSRKSAPEPTPNIPELSDGELEGLGMTPSEVRRAAPSAQIMKPKRKKSLAIAGSSEVKDPRDEEFVSTVQLDPNEIKRKLAARVRAEASGSTPAEDDSLEQPTQQMTRPSPEEIAARSSAASKGAAQPSRKVVVNFDD